MPPVDNAFRGIFVKAPDAKVKEHPGGTEAEALAERRALGKKNWPITPWSAVWRTRRRPTMPPELRAVQVTLPPASQMLLRAEAACGGSLDDFECLMRAYDKELDPSPACSRKFGAKLLDKYRGNNVTMCGGPGSSSQVHCGITRAHSAHDIDTAVCGAANAAINYDSIANGDFPWLAFGHGALGVRCDVRADAKQSSWHFMHCLKDWMDLGFTPTRGRARCDTTVSEPTYFMTRSGDYSPFALIHDWVNSVLLYAAGGLRPSATRVVIMDRMTVGFFTPVWQLLFSPQHELEWFPDMREKYLGKTACYDQAWFNIPARLSPLYNEDACVGSAWIRLSADLVMASVGGLRTASIPDRVVVTVIIRRNYATGHPIGRRIGNAEQLVSAIRDLDKTLIVNALDYADLDFDQQVNVSRATDVLVGMHGAGLIQALFLPPYGGLFEFFCPDRPSSNIRYKELSKRVALAYASYSIPGDDNVVPLGHAVPQIGRLIATVRGLKERARSGAPAQD